MTTSFAGYTFTRTALKKYSIAYNTKVGVYWCLSPVNQITNEYKINLQMIATNDCYKL